LQMPYFLFASWTFFRVQPGYLQSLLFFSREVRV
jgi:hypothetical protein